MYDFLFSCQQAKAKDFKKHSCNVMFPQIQQQVTDMIRDDLRPGHQQVIQEGDNQIKAIQYENEGLEG